MYYLPYIVLICLSIQNTYTQVTFENLCSSEVHANGLSSVDGNDEFEIEINEGKFLSDDVIICKRNYFFENLLRNNCIFLVSIQQKRPNDGIDEFALRAFSGDDIPVGRFEDQQTGNLVLKHHTCSNGASVRI